ncbi:MAG: flagellar protein FlgN [Nitrospiraceae bacterium]|nr:MAG: flagellar protein FlgN [Nitrospiraceae bacterium]
MTPDSAIISILSEQVNSYKNLHALLSRERECLVAIDSERIETISKEKDTVIMRLRLLEEERQRLLREFARDHSCNDDINLDDLAEITGNGLFRDLRLQLRSLLQSIEEINRFNAILIDRSLSHLKTNSNFLRLFRSGPHPQSTGVLLSKET